MAKKTGKKAGGQDLAERIRAFRWNRQGMAGRLDGTPAWKVISQTGWLRSVGGASPYLALRDRAGLSRADVDRALAKLEIHELPSARGCTYVIGKDDFPLALRAGQSDGDDPEITAAKKYCGVTDKELDRLAKVVTDAVRKTPLDPGEIKEAAGDAVRTFGPDAKKRGLTTTLPLVLGRLQSMGEIRRVPVDGRLDRQRYKYALWSPNPLAKYKLGDEEVAVALAERFFRWAGPAKLAELAWWSGLGMKAAKAAAAEIDLIPIADGDERLLLSADRDELEAASAPSDPAYSFVGLLDNLVHPRRELVSVLDAEDAKIEFPGDRGKAAGTLADLSYHPIVDRGRLIGLWDFDGTAGALIFRTFGKTQRPLADLAKAFEVWIKDELEDVRSFSLDSPESRSERIDALKAWNRASRR